MVAVELHRDAEVTEEVDRQGVCCCQSLLVEDGLNFWPLREAVHI